MSIEYIAIVVIGGIGTVFGAVAGAIVFIVVEPLGLVGIWFRFRRYFTMWPFRR